MRPAEGATATRAAAPTGAEPDRAPLLAFLADEESESMLRAGLAETLDSVTVRRGGIRNAIRALERERTPRILVIDLSGEEDPISALDELATVCEPDVTVLAIGEQGDIAFYREITRDLGVAEYLAKPLTRETVARLFGRRVAGLSEVPQHRSGRVVAVCGVRGGAGATTMAVNLALQLAEATRAHIGLLDLNLRGGTAAMMLGLRCTAGLRVALEEPDRVDALFVDRASVPVSDRLRLLGAEEPPDAALAPTPEGVTRVLELLRTRCHTIVVDLPYPPGPMERQVLALARHRILVLGPDLAGVRDTLAARKLLAGLPGTGTVLTLLNRAGAPGMLPAAMVEEGLGAAPDVVVPDLPRHLPRIANLGRAAQQDCAPLIKALAPLAQEVGGRRSSGGRASWLGRLRGAIRR